MATDKTGTWSFGEPVLWYTPSSNLDNTWSYGENAFLDEYVAVGGGEIKADSWHPEIQQAVREKIEIIGY